MGDWIFAFVAYVGAPILLASRFGRADWKEIANAYCIFWGALLLWGLGQAGSVGEKVGWPLIFGMFLSTPGILIIVLLARRLGFRLPWFA